EGRGEKGKRGEGKRGEGKRERVIPSGAARRAAKSRDLLLIEQQIPPLAPMALGRDDVSPLPFPVSLLPSPFSRLPSPLSRLKPPDSPCCHHPLHPSPPIRSATAPAHARPDIPPPPSRAQDGPRSAA